MKILILFISFLLWSFFILNLLRVFYKRVLLARSIRRISYTLIFATIECTVALRHVTFQSILCFHAQWCSAIEQARSVMIVFFRIPPDSSYPLDIFVHTFICHKNAARKWQRLITRMQGGDLCEDLQKKATLRCCKAVDNRSLASIGRSFPKREDHPFPDEPFRLTTMDSQPLGPSARRLIAFLKKANTVAKRCQVFW